MLFVNTPVKHAAQLLLLLVVNCPGFKPLQDLADIPFLVLPNKKNFKFKKIHEIYHNLFLPLVKVYQINTRSSYSIGVQQDLP